MSQPERRGVSLGTVFMLLITLAVVTGCIAVLPRLMGSVNIDLEELAMRSSTNLNDSLPELTFSDIPLSAATTTPETSPEPVATQTPAPTATPTPETPTLTPVTGTIVLTFVGSVNMDDLIRKSGYYSDSGKYDFTDNLALIAQEMDSDCTLVTLESITDSTGNIRQMPNAPEEVMDMLASANVDIVALGYNRAFERGLSGASATIAEAGERGMETLGLYDSEEDAGRIRIIDVNGVQVAYLHYTTAVTTTAKRKLNDVSWAQPMTSVSAAGAEAIAADIRLAREMGAHVVVVSINWSGSDSINTTSTKMKSFMQTLADAGADIIVGAGTKAVREISWIMGKAPDGSTHQTLCAWSLGSLLNGERNNGNVTGMLLHVQLSLSASGVNFELVSYTPTYIWRFKTDDYYRYRVIASDQPAPGGMEESQAANAAKAFANLKKTLGNSPVTLRMK